MSSRPSRCVYGVLFCLVLQPMQFLHFGHVMCGSPFIGPTVNSSWSFWSFFRLSCLLQWGQFSVFGSLGLFMFLVVSGVFGWLILSFWSKVSSSWSVEL